MSSRTTRSRSSGFVRSMCCSITRRSTSRGRVLVATRMSSRIGCSVTMPSIRVQRGVISVIPCTTSTRPPAVSSARIRRPNSSNGVARSAAPIPITRRPFSGTGCGMRMRSMPRSTGPSSVRATCRLATIVRVSSSSQTRMLVIGEGCVALAGSTATLGRTANRPSRTRPSRSVTWSARPLAASSTPHAGARAARRIRVPRDERTMVQPPGGPADSCRIRHHAARR